MIFPLSLSTSRPRRGTTLVELLVVIVIFLVGILAVVQIFPGGFRILTYARKNAQANALARAEAERLRAVPDALPELILPIGPALASGRATSDLGPTGDQIDLDGILSEGGTDLGHWSLYSGANRYRVIVGERHRVTAPRKVGLVGDDFGAAILPQFGPVEIPRSGNLFDILRVDGNLLAITPIRPADLENIVGDIYRTAAAFSDFDAYLEADSPTNPYLYVPTGPRERAYRMTVDVLVNRGGTLQTRTLRDLRAVVPAYSLPAGEFRYPLQRVELLAPATTVLEPGDTIVRFDPTTIRVRRAYRFLANGPFSEDAFEYRMLNPTLGLILLNPAASAEVAVSANGREPVEAVLGYQVSDWRVLREDMRLTEADGGQYKLPLGSLKTGSSPGPDGKRVDSLGPLDAGPTQSALADHFVIVDLETGGTVVEQDGGTQLVRVDKSQGVIRLQDADPGSAVLDMRVLLPGGFRNFPVEGRALRVLYQAREEWSVQVTKAASNYTATSLAPEPGRFYLGGTGGPGGLASRIYFPPSDAGQSVTVDEINYVAGGVPGKILGREFVVSTTLDANGLPYVDIREAVPNATLDLGAAPAVRGVEGSSLQVRALWNPDAFSLVNDPMENMRRLENWSRGYRRTTVQTFVNGVSR